MSAVAYVRCSTLGQDLSPDAQREAIAAYAARSGLTVTAWHSDIGVSGAAEVEDCPGLEAALAMLRKGDVLIVAKMDRLARDVFKHALVERLVAAQKASLVSADGVGNGDGPEAALLRAMVSAFSAYERALIRMRTKQALAVKKRQGLRVSRFPPFGYSFHEGRCVPVASEQAALEAGRVLRASGLSAGRVVTRLRKQGLVTGPGRGLIKALRAG